MYYLGIDIGASAVGVVALGERREGGASAIETPLFQGRRPHRGNVDAGVRALLDEVSDSLGKDGCAGVVLTGSGAVSAVARYFPEGAVDGIDVLEDVPALTLGAAVLAPRARSVVSIGAQSSCFATGFSDGASARFSLNEGCAAGTGAFFEDQMERLGLPIEDYSKMVARAKMVPRLSGRCSVFAKTDIIHRQQEGTSVEDILLGLCYAVVKSFKATIVRRLPVERPVVLAGGVVENDGVAQAVRDVFGLDGEELVVDRSGAHLQAAGAAAHARGLAERRLEGRAYRGERHGVLDAMRSALSEGRRSRVLPRLDPLPSVPLDPGAGFETLDRPWERGEDGKTPVALGIDVGSTSTNLVLVDCVGRLLDAQYLRTRGNPRQAVRDGLASLSDRVGADVRVFAVGVTGSGRTMIGEMVGADVVRDEITAQARAAVAADPSVDTVFEIGGQDSKFISIRNRCVADFQMNKVCAAGTGSFVEEQAARLGIPMSDYGAIALSATSPVDLGERCTVFMETAANAALADGATKADVAAGICFSVVRNYLEKVVGSKRVGDRIVLQGGVAYNPAIVAAFRSFWGDRITVSPWFAVSGAVGAALLAAEAAGCVCSGSARSGDGGRRVSGRTAFRGFDLSGTIRASMRIDAGEIERNRAFFRKVDEIYLEGYDPVRDPSKKTVGIPRCLMMHKLFPMANAFFRALGFNVVLSDASDEETVRLSQQTAQGETCYPVKLVHGHMAQLLDRGVDYVFMPTVHTIRHVRSTVLHNYACPYMQSIPRIVADELGFERRGVKLVSPVFDMDFGQGAMASALIGVGEQLGKTKQETARAMLAGGFAVMEFTRKTEALGDELLASLAPGERVIVIITRNYGIVDPALNMGIPDLLLDRGQKVITVSHLHAHDLGIQADYPSVYWPFGQHIISGAKLVRRDPRLFAVYLTNHGCGPDTMLGRLFAEEMGDKPYLQIEMDEHYSKIGVETRVEAFLNAITSYNAPDERDRPTSTKVVNSACEPLDPAGEVGLPSVGPYGAIVSGWLRARGYSVRELPASAEALAAGRKETSSKEYYTFAQFLGMCLIAAAEADGDDHALQLALPSSLGGEADGVYDRVIRSVLDARGFEGVRVVAPTFELLPCTLDEADLDGLFAALLAGDVVQAAPPDMRDGIASLLASLAQGGHLSIAEVCAAARGVAAHVADFRRSGADPTVAIVGEWPLAVADDLVGGLWRRLEEDGYRIKRMPFAEYLLFLWEDACAEAEHERISGDILPLLGETAGDVTVGLPHGAAIEALDAGGCAHSCADGCDTLCAVDVDGTGGSPSRPVEIDPAIADDPLVGARERVSPHDEWVAVIERLVDMVDLVSEALGDASPYSCDRMRLRGIADEGMGLFAGGNGRYRYAKAIQESEGVDGVIVVSSMYENTDIVLRLRGVSGACPVFHLSLDGVLDQGVEERVRSFLYYVR